MAATTYHRWTYWILVILVVEKVVQHATVTIALITDWQAIRSTVDVDYRWLAFTGAIIGVLFAASLIGLRQERRWSLQLLTALALADIFGEFIAQGTLGINMTISFIVALAVLVLAQWRLRSTG